MVGGSEKVFIMGRKLNDYYVGYKNIGVEGSHLKHPATIEYYNNLNINKIKENRIELTGLDIETNHLTSEIKLLGFYDGVSYQSYTKDFLHALFFQVKKANKNNTSLAYWSRLDPYVLYKQFLLLLSEEEQKESLKKFGKVGGVWDRKKQCWKEKPVVSIEFLGFEFGIINVIRSSVQFYYISKYKKYMNKVWAFDIRNLYQYSLSIEGKRFPYYSKIDKSAHLVNWDKFKKDHYYRNEIVLKSNYLDSRVVRDLGLLVQSDFHEVYGYYPNTLMSYGSLTRAGIVATITNFHKEKETDEKVLRRKIHGDIKSIGIRNYYEKWRKKFGDETTKELFCMANESYSGGYIETLKFGYSEVAFMSDIASAYPSVEVELFDLRNAEITSGHGVPPNIKNSYCFIRGDIKTPLTLNYNPITVKHPFSKTTNIRGVGEYKASYLLESRELLLKYGCKFTNEYWVNIETKGIKTPFAMAIQSFVDTRTKLIKEFGKGNSKEMLAKGNANSGYGIMYECTPIYKNIDDEIIKVGYRAGEFYNPIYASIITGFVRNKIFENAMEIENNGGQVLLIMTDSIFWKGEITNLPNSSWKEKKTLGYFEKPDKITKFMCLGAGRYEYYLENSKYASLEYKGKTRGIKLKDLQNNNGVEVSKFNWKSLIHKAIALNSCYINVNTRILVSPSLVSGSLKYKPEDIGLVKVENRKIDILAGKSKRMMRLKKDWLPSLVTEMIDTKPLYLFKGMEGDNKIIDFTLPKFRIMIKEMEIQSLENKNKDLKQKHNKSYWNSSGNEHNNKCKLKYNIARKYGFNSKDSRIISKKNWKDFYNIIGKGV